MRKQEQQEIEQPIIVVGICLHIHDLRKIQTSVQELLKKEIFTLTTKSGFNNQPLITSAEKTHYVTCAIGVIYALENHLILRNILCILYDLREHKHTFAFKLLQRLICYFSREGSDLRKCLFFLLGVILDPE